MRKFFLFFSIFLILLFTGCANKNISTNNTVVVNKEVVKKQKEQNIETIEKKLSVNCNNLKNILIEEENKYLNDLKNNLSLSDMSKKFHQIIYLKNSFNQESCTLDLYPNFIPLTKYYFVKTFLLQNKPTIDNFFQKEQSLTDTLIDKKQLLNIAENYKEEIEGFSPFTSDETIWDEELESPLKDFIVQIDDNYILYSESLLLNFLHKITTDFIKKSHENNFNIREIDSSNVIMFKYPKFVYKTFSVDKSEESPFFNTIYSAVEWTPIVGDALTIVEWVSDKCPKSNENCQKALNYIQKEVNYWQQIRINDLNNNYKNLNKSLQNLFFNILKVEK